MVTTAGAETLPFLASCIVLPASLGFFMLYGKMVEALPAVRQQCGPELVPGGYCTGQQGAACLCGMWQFWSGRLTSR